MRSYDATDADDVASAKRLLAQPWQLEMLAKNPSYPCWGNWEDYMAKSGESGWDKPVEIKSVSELFDLDDYNEVVNFYFAIRRENCECPHCEGSGQNPQTKALSDGWYSFGRERYINLPNGRRYNDLAWQYHLTEVEVKALVEHGRLSDLMDKWCRFDREEDTWKRMNEDGDVREWVNCEAPKFPTPEQVNEWAMSGFGHDAINQWVCVRARAEHQGVYGKCEHCTDGRIYSGEAELGLQMWVLHPRKGASRGVYLNDIKQEEIPQVIAYLKEAAERNTERFSKL